MRDFLKIAILFICIQMPLSAMHFARIVKKVPKRSTITRRYINESKKATCATTIMYKGEQFTPATFAGHMVLQAAAIGMSAFKACLHTENMECMCIKPYLILPLDEIKEFFYDERSKFRTTQQRYEIATQQLDYATIKYADEMCISSALQATQKNLCPHVQQCCKQLSREMLKKPTLTTIRIPFAITTTVLLLGGDPVLAGCVCVFCTTLGFGAACCGWLPQELNRKTNAMTWYLKRKTTEIDYTLQEHAMGQTKITASKLKYLSAPQKQN